MPLNAWNKTLVSQSNIIWNKKTLTYDETIFGFYQLTMTAWILKSVTVNSVKCVEPTVAYQQLLWSDGVICVDAKLFSG